jgi:hypothetical protein
MVFRTGIGAITSQIGGVNTGLFSSASSRACSAVSS